MELTIIHPVRRVNRSCQRSFAEQIAIRGAKVFAMVAPRLNFARSLKRSVGTASEIAKGEELVAKGSKG